MKSFEVTVSRVVTDYPKKTFVVLADNIVAAQKRVLSRIQGIMQTTMFQIRSAAEHSVQRTAGGSPL